MNHTRPLGARQDRFTQLPDSLLGALTPREHQLVHALLSYRWTPDAAIYPSVRTLARQLGCSDRTIQRTAHALEAKGYLIIEARYRDDQGQTSNIYRPGPLLIALLPASPGSAKTAAAPCHDHHPPVTRPSVERDFVKPYQTKQRQSTRRYQPGDLMQSRYGRYVRPSG
jgi:DNA-binding transcriptional MocR family regulator